MIFSKEYHNFNDKKEQKTGNSKTAVECCGIISGNNLLIILMDGFVDFVVTITQSYIVFI